MSTLSTRGARELSMHAFAEKAPKPQLSLDTFPDDMDSFYSMDDHSEILESPDAQTASTVDAPPLPQKNALRVSRLLDNLGLKLGGSLETHDAGVTTPHDLYLSSEEDVSSSADDFSDFEDDSNSEGSLSPGRFSHEDTARMVSVVFSGKPSVVQLPALKRRGSPASLPLSTRSGSSGSDSVESMSTMRTSVSGGSNKHHRKSSVFSTLLPGKQRPSFLDVDPYADGSKYSLDLSSPDQSPDAPTPTSATAHHRGHQRKPTVLLKNVSRSLGLAKKRSRPSLNTSMTHPIYSKITSPAPRVSLALPPTGMSPVVDSATTLDTPSDQWTSEIETPSTPMTYNDIVRTARKNSRIVSPVQELSSESSQTTPVSPVKALMKLRRKSVKLHGPADLAR